MAGRMYTMTFEGAALTTANADYDYFELTPADDVPIAIHAVYVSFYTEVGDAQEELIRWGIVRGHTTSGSTPNNTNIRALDPKGPAAVTTGEALNSTIASAGTGVTLHADAFNVRVGLVYVPTPEMRPRATQGDTTIVIRQFSTLVDDASASGTVYFEEL
jgi:hypothetical protein